jgi:hypothetical protein
MEVELPDYIANYSFPELEAEREKQKRMQIIGDEVTRKNDELKYTRYKADFNRDVAF